MVASALAPGRKIAYFSMEVALDVKLPTYSGGLGVLAGDTLRAAADMSLPVVCMTMLYRKGFFQQRIDAEGRQTEGPVEWNPSDMLQPVSETAVVEIEGRVVHVRAWRYDARGETGHVVPVYFLDASAPENDAYDRSLTDHLYGGDERYRLCQETLLGIGGVAMLTSLGLSPVQELDDPAATGVTVFHMNEGHAALLTLALLRQRLGRHDVAGASPADLDWVRERCVFTTHTPVPAGHDTFPVELVETVLGKSTASALVDLPGGTQVCPGRRLNMSLLGIRFSRFVNGVAKRHAEVSRKMFPSANVESITNGVHAVSWTADAIRTLFDEHLTGWRQDNNHLRYAVELPLPALRTAHREAKRALFDAVKERAGASFDPDVFTIGFARRAAEYKRADLLFHDPDALRRLAERHPIQIVFAGKAHPKDGGGKHLIERVFAGAAALAASRVKTVYLENYDMTLGRLITSGVDLWLNTPVKPLEASGTSGMKTAINGVPSLSTLDGWWVEGSLEDVVGWEIKDEEYADPLAAASKDSGQHRAATARSIYETLEHKILPLYYGDPDGYARVMRNAIFINGPYFNTQRMVLQYASQGYMRRK